MKHLNISPDLELPVDAATQTFAFIARKGAGKTYAAGKLTEQLLEAGVQVVILDTVGNWYGLRLSADGKGKGFDVPVFGGLRGDLPLEAGAGELVADVAVDTGRSMILDVSQFSLGDRKRFAVSFGERLWKKKKAEAHPSPLMLVIEESQLIIPQFTGRGGDDARMVGIYEEIIRLGRNYGIGCTMISQRPQSVNKEVLNQTECLFVLQVNGAQERKALKEWITHQGMDTNLVDELPSLPVGTAYVWSPQWLQILKKVRIGKKVTFDASSTPKVGEKSVRRDPAPLDLAEIQQRMASVVDRAKENDPKALREKIARLASELAKATKAAPKVEMKTIEKPVLKDTQISRLDQLLSRAEKLAESQNAVFSKILEQTAQISLATKKLAQPSAAQRQPVAAPNVAVISTWSPRIQKTPAVAKSSESMNGVRGTQLRILNAVAWWKTIGVETPTRAQVGFIARIKPTGGHFSNTVGPLTTGGYLENVGDGAVRFTPAGEQLAIFPDIPPTMETYHAAIASVLQTGAQQRILSAIIARGGADVPIGEIGHATGIDVAGGHFSNSIGPMGTLGLIERRAGMVRPTPLLFPPSLTYSR